MVHWVVGSIPYGGPIELFLIPQYATAGAINAVVCALLSDMVYIKDPLLLIRKSSSQRASSVFPFSLSELSFTIISHTI